MRYRRKSGCVNTKKFKIQKIVEQTYNNKKEFPAREMQNWKDYGTVQGCRLVKAINS